MSYQPIQYQFVIGGLDPTAVHQIDIRVDSHRRICVPKNISEDVGRVTREILRVLSQHFPVGIDIFTSELAVSEAMDNVLNHGFVTPSDRENHARTGDSTLPYPMIDVSRRIPIELMILDYRNQYGQRTYLECVLTVSDCTPPYNEKDIPDPTVDSLLENPSGRGALMCLHFGTKIMQVIDRANPHNKKVIYRWRQNLEPSKP